MGADSKLKAAGLGVGALVAGVAAWLGIKSHEDHLEEERARLQAEYEASRAQTMAHLDVQHQEVMNTIQELGQSNPQSNFTARLRPNKPSYVETQNAQAQEQQAILNMPEVS